MVLVAHRRSVSRADVVEHEVGPAGHDAGQRGLGLFDERHGHLGGVSPDLRSLAGGGINTRLGNVRRGVGGLAEFLANRLWQTIPAYAAECALERIEQIEAYVASTMYRDLPKDRHGASRTKLLRARDASGDEPAGGHRSEVGKRGERRDPLG